MKITTVDKNYVKSLLEDSINDKGSMSFTEIEEFLKLNSIEVKGETTWKNYEANIIFWYGMSEIMSDSLKDLNEEGIIQIIRTVPDTYYADGKHPDLPLAKRPPCNGYVKEHWMPIIFKTNYRINQ